MERFLKEDKDLMDNCFPVGNTVLIAMILHFHTAGFSVPIADNRTAGKEFVTLNPCWGQDRPKGSPAIELASFAQWTQKGGV
jgi:hypothetical protein